MTSQHIPHNIDELVWQIRDGSIKKIQLPDGRIVDVSEIKQLEGLDGQIICIDSTELDDRQ